MEGGGEGGGSRLVTFRNIAHLTAVSTMLLPFVCLSVYRSSFFPLHFVTPWLLIQQKDTPFLWTALRWFPFAKIPVWNFGHFTCPMQRPDPTRPDPSHRAFGYYSCKQDTKERYWRQQFCPWSNIPFWTSRNGLFQLISNRNFQNLALNGKRP